MRALLLADGEVGRQDEVGNLHAVDLVAVGLDCIARLEPVKHQSMAVARVRALHLQSGLRIADQFEDFSRQLDDPGLVELSAQLSEYESAGNPAVVSIEVAESVVETDTIPQVDKGVAAHVRQRADIRHLADKPFQAKATAETSAGLEVTAQQLVDDPDRALGLFVARALGAIDHGYQPAMCTASRWLGWM